MNTTKANPPKEHVFTVIGNSMFPTIKKGERVNITPPVSQEIQIGEVVLFKSKEKLIVHRIVGKIKLGKLSYIIHKGDNSSKPGITSQKNIIGKADEIKPLKISRIKSLTYILASVIARSRRRRSNLNKKI